MRKRSSTIQLRVTPQEKKRIERNARRCEMTLSNYLRQRAVGYAPRVLPREEILLLHQELCRLKGQISKSEQPELLHKLAQIQQGLFVLCFPPEGESPNGNDQDLAH